MTLISRARIFADAAHGAANQKRKYTGRPYIEHPAEVASMLGLYGFNESVIAAGWLHDVFEDTEVTKEQLTREFGYVVTSLVLGVTDISKPEDGKRVHRKALDRAHIAKQCLACKAIKLCDVISNCQTIVLYDSEFARTYLQEKALLLGAIRVSHEVLWHRAYEVVSEGLRSLGLPTELEPGIIVADLNKQRHRSVCIK